MAILTRAQLVDQLATKTGATKKHIKETLELLGEAVIANEKVALPFGIFKRKKTAARKARKGVNPFTGEPMTIKAKPATSVLKFTPSKDTKEKVAKKR